MNNRKNRIIPRTVVTCCGDCLHRFYDKEYDEWECGHPEMEEIYWPGSDKEPPPESLCPLEEEEEK